MTNLTARQAEVLAFIREHIAENGGAPTRAEIAAAFGLRSANSAEQYLRTLAEKGHLEVTGQARGIRLAVQHRERRVAHVVTARRELDDMDAELLRWAYAFAFQPEDVAPAYRGQARAALDLAADAPLTAPELTRFATLADEALADFDLDPVLIG